MKKVILILLIIMLLPQFTLFSEDQIVLGLNAGQSIGVESYGAYLTGGKLILNVELRWGLAWLFGEVNLFFSNDTVLGVGAGGGLRIWNFTLEYLYSNYRISFSNGDIWNLTTTNLALGFQFNFIENLGIWIKGGPNLQINGDHDPSYDLFSWKWLFGVPWNFGVYLHWDMLIFN